MIQTTPAWAFVVAAVGFASLAFGMLLIWSVSIWAEAEVRFQRRLALALVLAGFGLLAVVAVWRLS